MGRTPRRAREDSDVESEIPPPSFLDAINAVYQFIPPEDCPKMVVPPPSQIFVRVGYPRYPQGATEATFSPTVGLLVKEIEGHLVEDGKRAGTFVPKGFTAHQGSKFYLPHNATWPVKPPPLDKDAGLIGVTKPPTPAPSLSKVWESSDQRLRSIVAMASHVDLCLGATRGAVEEEDSIKLEALIQSAAKGTRHILGTALMASSDILLCGGTRR